MRIPTCEEVLGKVKRERQTWMSDDTWKLVEEIRKLKAKLVAATNMYNEKNHEVKRSSRRDKRRRIR